MWRAYLVFLYKVWLREKEEKMDKTVVVKIGSGVVLKNSRRFAKGRMRFIAQSLNQFRLRAGVDIILVVSGAIARGSRWSPGDDAPSKQFAATFGWHYLLHKLKGVFEPYEMELSPALLTAAPSRST